MRLVFNAKDKEIFDSLKNGIKKVETRAGSVKYQNINIGDEIIFSCANDTFTKKVSKVTKYKNVSYLLAVYNPEDINPTLHTKKEIIEMYAAFPGYSEKIKNFGIVALEFT